MKRKKIYYPQSQIKTGLYTSGGELAVFETNEEYIGTYHYYLTTKEIFSNSEYNKRTSVKLKLLDRSKDNTYENLRGKLFKSTKGYKSPISIYSPPTEKDYRNGSYKRYFSKKVNDSNSNIIEIDKDQYDKIINKSGDLDYILYKAIELDWKLTGSRNDIYENGELKEYGIYDTNRRLILMKNISFKNLNKFLTNPLEFARITK